MNLLVGGAFQGKREAAMELSNLKENELIDGALCTFESVYTARGIDHFHEYIKRMLKEDRMTDGFIQELYKKNPDVVLISTELGYGVVPIEAFDRMYRERTGRLLCEAAKLSQAVYRVVAGLPVCIKGEDSCR